MSDATATSMLKETLADGTRREWFMAGAAYAGTTQQRATIQEAIDDMHWQRPGTEFPMSTGLMLQELVHQFTKQTRWIAELGYSTTPVEHRVCSCKNAPDYCDLDCWGTYSVLGMRLRQRRHWWTVYFLDIGVGAVLLCGDTTDAHNPAGSMSVACALTWHEKCNGTLKTRVDPAAPCGCSCRHPHVTEDGPVDPLFSTGREIASHGALEIGRRREPAFLAMLLNRHIRGDWGDVGEHDGKLNDEALTTGDRILLSIYGKQGDPDRIYILTEADRSVTTILRPDEY